MTTYKNSFDKLTPCEQVAIESMAKDAKANELINIYKETKAKETLKKKPNVGENILITIIIVAAIIGLFIIPMITINTYEDALKSAGPTICQARDSNYTNTVLNIFSVKINCEGFTVTLP